MSASKELFRHADEISVGFLSAKTSAVLNRGAGEDLSETDKETLDDAVRLLETIAAGASIATSGTFRQGVSPSRSMAAFDLALGPLGVLKQVVGHQEQVDRFFASLAEAVKVFREAGKTPNQPQQLETARIFFSALRDWLAEELNTNRRVGRERADRFFSY